MDDRSNTGVDRPNTGKDIETGGAVAQQALKSLEDEISAHRNADKHTSYLGSAVKGAAHLISGRHESVESLEHFRDEVKTWLKAGNADVSQIQEEVQQRVKADQDDLRFKEVDNYEDLEMGEPKLTDVGIVGKGNKRKMVLVNYAAVGPDLGEIKYRSSM